MSENFSDDLQEKPKPNPREMEEGKPPLNISLFELFRDAFSNRLTPLRATKVTLVDISHSLEELVIADRLPAMVFTGFQESSYWRKEADRYLKMAGIAHSISIFAGGMPPEAPGSNYLHVRLSYNDTLRQEWFLLILTHHFSVLLCGRDRLEDFEKEAERAFDTLWTFEPDLIQDLALLLARVIEHYRPERYQALMQGLAQFPPLQPDARYVTLLSARVVDHLERQYEAQRVRLRSEPDTAPQTIAADQQIDTALLPLFSGKYLLLLLGNLDQSRLEAIAAKILPDMLNFKASHLFIDMSKLGEMSPDAAIRLVRLVRELNVCGVRASLSGLTPMVASVFVAQNLDTLGIATYRSLDEAIAAS